MSTFFYPSNIHGSFKQVAIAMKGAIKVIIPKDMTIKVGGVEQERKSNYTPDPTHKIINWGHTGELPDFKEVKPALIVNSPEQITSTSRHLNSFLPEEVGPNGEDCVGYKKEYNGQSITAFYGDKSWDNCHLWRRYIPHSSEYRIHVGVGGIFCMERKLLRKTDDNGKIIDKAKINWRQRSRVNGFLYSQVYSVPDAVTALVRDIGLTHRGLTVLKILYSKSTDTATLWDYEFTPFLEKEYLINTYSQELRRYI